jgi:hypothetical protein
MGPQGSISSYLAGASSMLFWLSAATSMTLGTVLAVRTVAGLVLRRMQ